MSYNNIITVPFEPFDGCCKQDMDENKFNEDPQKECNGIGLLLVLFLLILVLRTVLLLLLLLLIEIDDLFILE